MGKNLHPDTVDALITQALAIEDEEARNAGKSGFMGRAMVQATLPHHKVEGNEFERRKGNFKLTLQAPSKVGLPYGTVPDYARLRDFKAALITELKKVLVVYGRLQVEALEDGLLVKPSLTHIGKKST